MAYFTGTEALQQGFPGRIKKLNVSLLGSPGRTTGAAEDPGSLYTYIKQHLEVNIAQAALGADVDIPTVDGLAKLKIPAGTQPGKVLRLRGKGIPHLRGSVRGDQLVIVNVEVPTHLNSEQRRLFEQLAKSLGSEVKPQERGFLDWVKETLGG